MDLKLSIATPEDAESIVAIHLAPFVGKDSQPPFALCPHEGRLAGNRQNLTEAFSKELILQDNRRIYLVVRDTPTNQIISFAKWELPCMPIRDLKVNDSPLDFAAHDGQMRVVGATGCYRKIIPISTVSAKRFMNYRGHPNLDSSSGTQSSNEKG